MRNHSSLHTAAMLLVLAAAPALAQSAPPVSLEGQAGYAGFIDDATIDHVTIGGGARVRLTPRLSVGPEVIWMRGPGGDRDLFLTATLMWDVVSPRSPAIVPYLIAGGGVMRHSDRFGAETFSSWEGALTGGAGARVRLGPRWYVAPEFRIGWEPHYRVGVTVGWSSAARSF